MMGFKVTQPAVLFIDNLAVVTNTTLPSSSLKKKHNAIAYHKIRKAVAAGIVKIAHVPTKQNLADLLTKPVSPQELYALLQGILFKIYKERKGEPKESENQGELQMVTVHEPSR